mmetsp:Transcript_5577/g.7341  ORF Transcript_5577/g.7341 Transcript_5577/m.7341 type:complete len:136 (+) Transcript_5577:124-531(+)|eukprot:CAMPEP_0198144404 /NCGR_PEP_ID=MMETSP1443-20131203/15439_1 /TAXON_ID=186043 /ORGANISM="Entomoneis sp., Strain CCMP2396" /LENGTH=135 /DNA_ID=CAMNT_0043807791 /DNA_START=90 /DNA_END=497 /DNA_ORIENTATION=-
MPSIQNYLAMFAVGAFWGCTNPLLRHGVLRSDPSSTQEPENNSFLVSVLSSLQKFRHVEVWMPYALNQAGSVLFYFTLGSSEISLAVPICNGLALVFSIITSFIIGEKVESPARTILGASLVVVGVAICVMSSSE